ncbi:endoglucanase (plasmid) [Deinococcus taeanensis]|uniref:glycoside hydrolase family 26 protein n=1 Tax=Deinococcus taeanensis TaxID=2737050 RepID=UPI001CDC8131|nr:glycosyl hydrolase [Deinococcus taeanensis]UBV45004.1 endoglucanase [Deinococcus taeanensis]
MTGRLRAAPQLALPALRLPLTGALLCAAFGTSSALGATCGPFGITLPQQIRALTDLERQLGCQFQSVRWYQDWNTAYNAAYARDVARGRRALEISWQPQVRVNGNLRGIPFREIAAGKHDAVARQLARDIRRARRPVTITFAPEMNGNWSVYQLNTKNTASDFRAAWKHLHALFKQERAPVRWAFVPNILFPQTRATYRTLYPGDAFVDEVGLDGYNWGTTNPWNRWKSFDDTFSRSYKELAAVTRKPMQLGEVGSVERGGNKAAWIGNMCRALPRYPRLVRLFWFHLNVDGVDWRVNTSDAALKAFRTCAQSFRR